MPDTLSKFIITPREGAEAIRYKRAQPEETSRRSVRLRHIAQRNRVSEIWLNDIYQPPQDARCAVVVA